MGDVVEDGITRLGYIGHMGVGIECRHLEP